MRAKTGPWVEETLPSGWTPCILHCVSIYPVDSNNVNLNNMRMLKQEFPDYPIGFSDHTIGSEVACAAVAFGAAIIEKHFTLDKEMEGPDHKASS